MTPIMPPRRRNQTDHPSARVSKDRTTGPTFECPICVETRPLRKSFNPKGCAHFYCNKCTARYIESKLSVNSSTRISCPEPGCQGILDPELCRQILPRNLFDRWGKALADSAIDASQKFYCPYSDCSVLLINDGGGGEVDCRRSPRWGFLCRGRIESNPKRATCPSCKRAVCVDCKCAWHSEMECETYRKLMSRGGEDGMVNWLAAKKRWKKCPKCSSLVEKRDGCDRIRCRCGKEFCYRCGGSYYNIHSQYSHVCREGSGDEQAGEEWALRLLVLFAVCLCGCICYITYQTILISNSKNDN